MKAIVEVRSTEQIHPRRRVEYWNEQASWAITKLEVDPPKDAPFNSTLKHVSFGDISFMEAISTPAKVFHLCSSIYDTKDPCFLIHLQRSGRTLNSQANKDTSLESGDFTLCDGTLPCMLLLEGNNSMLVMRIPYATLKRVMPAPEMLINMHMSGKDGVSRLISEFMNAFWQQCLLGIDDISGRRIAENICDMIATSFAEKRPLQADRSATQLLMRHRIEQEINARLPDADLSPRGIATKVNISTRYLHKLFSDDTDTVSRYILRRRLDECAKALADPRQNPKTISTIAYEWGFNNTTYFARVFRKHYELSPSEYRAEKLARPLS